MNRKIRFLTYCGLTCLGGSERKECPCTGPSQCEMRKEPGSVDARRGAKDRTVRFIRNTAIERMG